MWLCGPLNSPLPALPPIPGASAEPLDPAMFPPLPDPPPLHPAQHPVFVAINALIMLGCVIAVAWSWFAVWKPMLIMVMAP